MPNKLPLTLRLVHWRATEAEAYLHLLRRAGHHVDYDEEFRPGLLKAWRESPPDAFIIDLSRLPSHGREIAIALRQSPKTRAVPLIFCEGEEAKVARLRAELPDATFCSAAQLAAALPKAVAKILFGPVVPAAMMERYASRTTAQKLGIREGSTVVALNTPRDFPALLGLLPPSVSFEESSGDHAPLAQSSHLPAVTLCFLDEVHAIASTLSTIRPLAARSKLWILWRKGRSAIPGSVTESLVREAALDLGLVDYKVCSVSSVWSALLFALKK